MFDVSPSVTRHSQRGIALVITLIMLAVTLVMAVAFLAIARRERNAATTATDTAVARLADDAALAAAQAQIAANILATTNPYNYSLLVSTNYQNGAGFFTGVASPTNVNYDFYNGTGLGPVSGNDLVQNIANLYLLPRAPVFVNNPNTGSNDFRFYLDLNRNGAFDPNGSVTNVDNLGNAILGANGSPLVTVQGDPEWIGVLEHPDQPHGPNNPFVARYAFLAQPAGNSLDLNYIHNQAKRLGPAAQVDGARRVVVALDPERRRVVVGPPSGGSRHLTLREVNWLAPPARMRLQVKLRARETPHEAEIAPNGSGAAVVLDAPTLAAPGQACVFYDGDRVMGGGFIERPALAVDAGMPPAL